MKDNMGTYHSSLNCERLALSFRSCFGYDDSTTSYQPEPNKARNSNNSSLCNENSFSEKCATDKAFVGVSNSKRRKSRKGSCSKDSCCIRGSEADKDDFSYNICSQSNDSQLNSSDRTFTMSNSSASLNQSHGSTCSSNCKSTRDISKDYQMNCRNSSDAQKTSIKPKAMAVIANTNGSNTRTVINNNDVKSSTANDNGNFESDEQCSIMTNNGQFENKQTELLDNRVDCVDNATSNPLGSEPLKIEDINEIASIPPPTRVDDGVMCFRNLVSTETDRLNVFIQNWNSVLDKNTQCPVEVCDEIRTVIGQTRLVITERFTQFSTLIDRAEGIKKSAKDDRPVLLSDLQGFWDMIYFQVQDVDAKFDSLEKMKANNWKSTDNHPVPTKVKADATTPKKPQVKRQVKKQPAKKKSQMSEEDRKRREAARKRLAEARKALAQRNQVEQDTSSTETSTNAEILTTSANFITDNNQNSTSSSISGPSVLPQRPDSIVDAISCAVAVGQVNPDTPPITSLSTTSLVH